MAPDTLTTPEEMAEILKSLELARRSGASTYVELGVRRAGTSMRVRNFLERTKVRGRLFGVDIDRAASGYWQRAMGKPKGAKGERRLTWKFLLASSQDALGLIEGPIAWVFVDACHCTECATADIEGWGSKLAPGGVLVVHDTTPRRRHYTKPFQHNRTRRFGVWEAVDTSEREGWLSRYADKVVDHDDKNGLRVYVRRTDGEVGCEPGGRSEGAGAQSEGAPEVGPAEDRGDAGAAPGGDGDATSGLVRRVGEVPQDVAAD